MGRLQRFASCTVALVGTLLVGGQAHAAAVACGDASLGTRQVQVSPAKTGGFCYAQDGNLRRQDFTTVEARLDVFYGKTASTDPANAWRLTELDFFSTSEQGSNSVFTRTDTEFGTWSLTDPGIWSKYASVLIGFHFGGGGNGADTRPDSFVVELASADRAGDWKLMNGKLNGISNYYVFGYGPAAQCEGQCGNFSEIPEPAGALLAGIALAALVRVRRRRATR